MPAVARPRATDARQYTSWDRARLSVVVPIGVIVAVAIVCIVVAVLSSARHADVVAIDHERQLFSSGLSGYGERILREVESVASSDAAVKNVRRSFDPEWAKERVGNWLATYFDHDYVFIFDRKDEPVYSLVGRRAADSKWLASVRADVSPIIDYMRGREPSLPSAVRLSQLSLTEGGAHPQTAVIRRLMGRPAVVAAVAVRAADGVPQALDNSAPIIMSVKFIDDTVLSNISTQLRLVNLRRVDQSPLPAGDADFTLSGADGSIIARYAWTPKQPGAEIVHNVVPFIAVALAGFALLAAFVLRYMRRTAAAIAAGESRLRHLAMHDPLCGLPNRIFFGERLEAVIEEVRGGSAPSAVFYVDLDHFKDVNDTLGHHVGDELIRNVTLRLSHTLRGGDLVARLGGDEFAVITSIAGDSEKMMMLAQRIISAICAPYSIGGQNIIIGASIGIAVIDKNCGTATDVMRYADMALYRAKNEGRNRACVYDAAMDADLSTRKLLEADLREAIENDSLQLLYQPVVNKSGETVVGVEALCRWYHPTRGEIPPSEFIAIAEHSGLIIDLGNWVLRRACLDGRAWPELTIAVNVSSLQFRRVDFVDVVERILKETQFNPERLELELTESVLLGNVDTAETAMFRLKTLGVRLALDDFGTGYSSLLYLRRFPFDKLKIDRSFVRSIEKAADAAAIVHAIVSLGRGLGMKVTAEGVETADQQLFLRAAGVHSLQGYRFGRPVTVAEICDRLNSPANFHPIEIQHALAS
ncbi:MAG TPA: EAL domain-containing protein [Pseudolabrys sp.]|nr:EAL domain-containing protein [Pseudolabrys sp.]